MDARDRDNEMTAFTIRVALALAGVAALAMEPSAAGAQATTDRAPLLQRLMACREITSTEARLACFDQAAGAFDAAERQGEVTVVDRAQANETRNRLFGLSLGTANLFGSLRLDPPVEAIESTLTSARRDQNGKWVFVLADGSTWHQIDTERMSPQPRPGQSVRVRQGAINSYLLSVGGARSVRARRDN